MGGQSTPALKVKRITTRTRSALDWGSTRPSRGAPCAGRFMLGRACWVWTTGLLGPMVAEARVLARALR